MNIVFERSFLAKSYTPTKMSIEASYRIKIIEKYFKLRKEGLKQKETLEILEVKRSTFYRWLKLFKNNKFNKIGLGLNNKSKRPKHFRASKKISYSLIQQIYSLRQEFPFFGKSKITHILKQNNIDVSESTVGRVLKNLLDKGKIHPVAYFKKKNVNYRRTIRKRYAQRWKFNRPKEIGELIQIDHMVVTTNTGLSFREFRAVCPITRISYSKLYTKATAKNARDFLKRLQNSLPFKVKSIQTDGGSEFMKEFEEYCKEENIPMFILPPRSPRYNGKVERTNGTYRYEFYNVYEMPDTMDELNKMHSEFEYFYNYVRPHRALNNLSPFQYYDMIKLDNKVA